MNEGGTKRVVLVGGGHAHLYSLKHADELRQAGAVVTLVGPGRFHYYSGMGPGLLSRIYQPEQARFDVESLIRSRRGRFVQGRVASVDPDRRALSLEDGRTLGYDLVSFNTGSRVPAERIPGARETSIPVKPIENLEEARRTILERAREGTPEILIIGAGPAGVELAGNTWRLLRENGLHARITLSDAGERLLPGLPERASRIAHRSLSRRGVRVRTGFRTASLEAGKAFSEGGEEIPCDVLLLAIGIVPHGLYADSGLPTSADGGGLLTNAFLQSVTRSDIFGGGDCIAIQGARMDRVGVHAVREAPILFHNLRACLRGEPLKPFEPQRRYLLILNLGDGTGLLVWGPFALRGRWAFWWKNRLDTSFVSKYQLCGEQDAGRSSPGEKR